MSWMTSYVNHPSEKEYADFIGRKYAVAVNSCGSALFLALKAGGLAPGAGCFTNAFTFTAVPSCIIHAGGVPVLVECQENFTIDLDDFRAKIAANPDVKFFILSHMRGHVNDMDTISGICDENGIFLIDDCAHALGGEYDGKLVGSFGAPVACYSAQTNKMMNSGEGGILVTDDDWIAAYSIIGSGCFESNFQKHLVAPPMEVIEKARFTVPCFSMRMSAVTAAILRPQIGLIPKKVAKYRSFYAYLEEKFGKLPGIKVPQALPKVTRAPNSIQFRIEGVSRQKVADFVESCTNRGLAIQCFCTPTNSRYYKNWKFAYGEMDKAPECEKTDEMLASAIDLRLSTCYDTKDVETMGEIVAQEVEKILQI